MRFNTTSLYANVKTFDEGFFTSGDGKHRIHYLRSGRRGGRPVLIIHGGPGGASSQRDLGFFHPSLFDIVQIDQRGCGLSEPFGSLENNDTDHLIDDCEMLRRQLGFSSWTLWAGSFGTFVASVYGIERPESVDSVVLRAVCTLGEEETQVCFSPTGAATSYPERYLEFCQYVSQRERDDILAAYYRRMVVSSSPELNADAAYRWSRWLTSIDVEDDGSPYTLSDDEVKGIRMECLFAHKRGFRAHNYVRDNAHKLSGKDVRIVHGRRDLLCPPINAVLLSRAIAGSQLTMVENGAHSTRTPGMRKALLAHTNSLVR